MKTSDTLWNVKKAAIITFHSANNYGAVLQAFALQEYVNEKFGSAIIIDYHSVFLDQSYVKPKITGLLKKPKQTVFRVLQSILYKRKNEKIEQFRKVFFKLTDRYDINNIHAANSEADIFITGSDQVWNYLIIGNDTTFFLDFVDGEKTTCSYAASIGVRDIPSNYIEVYKNAISHVKYISVREKAGIQTLNDLGISEVEIMPDPTLLLSRKKWEELSINPSIKEKYILVYKITKAEKLIGFAKNLSKKTGLRIIYIPNDLKSGIVGSLKLSVGPQEWLGYIKNAEYVVTNSFHGTVFSILFGTKFFSEVSQKVNPSTSRLLSLLSMFSLEDRIIDYFTDEMIEKTIPMDCITQICTLQQELAYSYFERVYQGDN